MQNSIQNSEFLLQILPCLMNNIEMPKTFSSFLNQVTNRKQKALYSAFPLHIDTIVGVVQKPVEGRSKIWLV